MSSFSLFSDDDDLKRDAATTPLLDTLTITKEPSQEEAVVVGSPEVPPKKSTSVRASKHLHKAGAASTSLEVPRPTASSDNVSNAFCTRFFRCLILFSHTFVLQTLMQKKFSLGAECVGFQETARASQCMSIFVRVAPTCSCAFP
jgi:hypothetical protein